jgi:transitional endoplasmic reticulum ATPase
MQQTKEELRRNRELLSKIAELGGKGMKEEDIVYQGNKLILPERWTGNIRSAISYLQTKQKEEEEVSNFTRSYNFRPWDGAYNAFNAMKKAFGMVSGKTVQTFFGPRPPQYIQIPIGPNQTEEVPWGQFTIPLLEDTTFIFGQAHSQDYGHVFQITISSPRKNRFVIEGLFKLIEEELKSESIYRGKAIDGQVQPQFLDLDGFDETKVVYAEQVKADLDAHLWSVLRYSDANRELGLPLKRSILLTGPYGTGKSLAGLRTALEAILAGWTFIMARPGRDDFTEVMRTARLYQPAVVFMEDADTIAAADNEDMISQLLDLFDGIQAKNTDLMIVLTTNHPESLHKGMMRPGRLDAIIEIGALDDAGIEKLIRGIIRPDRLDQNVDFKPVVKACEGYMPAFIKEAADRAIRYALARNNGNIGNYQIGTEDLVHAATGLRPQFDRMTDAPEFSEGDTLKTSLEKIMQKSAVSAVSQLASKDEIYEAVWDEHALDEARKNGNS